MDPVSMGMAAASTLLPIAAKGLEVGLDIATKLLGSLGENGGNGPEKIGADQQQQAAAQITF